MTVRGEFHQGVALLHLTLRLVGGSLHLRLSVVRLLLGLRQTGVVETVRDELEGCLRRFTEEELTPDALLGDDHVSVFLRREVGQIHVSELFIRRLGVGTEVFRIHPRVLTQFLKEHVLLLGESRGLHLGRLTGFLVFEHFLRPVEFGVVSVRCDVRQLGLAEPRPLRPLHLVERVLNHLVLGRLFLQKRQVNVLQILVSGEGLEVGHVHARTLEEGIHRRLVFGVDSSLLRDVCQLSVGIRQLVVVFLGLDVHNLREEFVSRLLNLLGHGHIFLHLVLERGGIDLFVGLFTLVCVNVRHVHPTDGHQSLLDVLFLRGVLKIFQFRVRRLILSVVIGRVHVFKNRLVLTTKDTRALGIRDELGEFPVLRRLRLEVGHVDGINVLTHQIPVQVGPVDVGVAHDGRVLVRLGLVLFLARLFVEQLLLSLRSRFGLLRLLLQASLFGVCRLAFRCVLGLLCLRRGRVHRLLVLLLVQIGRLREDVVHVIHRTNLRDEKVSLSAVQLLKTHNLSSQEGLWVSVHPGAVVLNPRRCVWNYVFRWGRHTIRVEDAREESRLVFRQIQFVLHGVHRYTGDNLVESILLLRIGEGGRLVQNGV